MQIWEEYSYGTGYVWDNEHGVYVGANTSDTFEVYSGTTSSSYGLLKQISTSATSAFISAYSSSTYTHSDTTLTTIAPVTGSFMQLQTTLATDSSSYKIPKIGTASFSTSSIQIRSFSFTDGTPNATETFEIGIASVVTGKTRYYKADPGDSIVIYTGGTYGLPYPTEAARVTSSFSYSTEFGVRALYEPIIQTYEESSFHSSFYETRFNGASTFAITETLPLNRTSPWASSTYTNEAVGYLTETNSFEIDLWYTNAVPDLGIPIVENLDEIYASSVVASTYYVISKDSGNHADYVQLTRSYLRNYDTPHTGFWLGDGLYAVGNLFQSTTLNEKPLKFKIVEPFTSSGAYAQKAMVINNFWWSPAYSGFKPTPNFNNTILENYPSWNDFRNGDYPTTTISPLLFNNKKITATAGNSDTNISFISSYTFRAEISSSSTTISRTDYTTTGTQATLSSTITTTGSTTFSAVLTYGASSAPYISWDSGAYVFNGNIVNMGGYLNGYPVTMVAGDNNTQLVTRISPEGSTTTAYETWAAGQTIVSDGGVIAFRTNKPVQFGGQGEYATGIPVIGLVTFDREQ